MRVSSTDRDALEPFHDAFGGGIVKDKPILGKRPAWHWYVSAGKAERSLRLMLPHLQLERKTKAVWIALQFRKTQGRRYRYAVGKREFSDGEIAQGHMFHELTMQINSTRGGEP